MSLPPYDPKAKCPKCRHEFIKTAFHEPHPNWSCDERLIAYELNRHRQDEEVVEHLVRVCQRCHYEWAETVLSN